MFKMTIVIFKSLILYGCGKSQKFTVELFDRSMQKLQSYSLTQVPTAHTDIMKYSIG